MNWISGASVDTRSGGRHRWPARRSGSCSISGPTRARRAVSERGAVIAAEVNLFEAAAGDLQFDHLFEEPSQTVPGVAGRERVFA
jgi:acyl dehydratase